MIHRRQTAKSFCGVHHRVWRLLGWCRRVATALVPRLSAPSTLMAAWEQKSQQLSLRSELLPRLPFHK